MKIQDIITESQDFDAIARKFLPFAQKYLQLDQLPDIEFLEEPLAGTFGRYGDGSIKVCVGGRHPIDALRTLAHELTHYKQDSQGRIHDESGETGSDEENEANAEAGVMMRHFDQAYPELLKPLRESHQAELDEWSTTEPGIRKHLERKGYKFLGAGVDQSAYLEPGTGWVLKIFGTQHDADFVGKPTFSTDHQMFFVWARYCQAHADNPFLPRFDDYDSFRFGGKTYLMIRQEALRSAGGARGMGGLLSELSDYAEEGLGFERAIKSMQIEMSNAQVQAVIQACGGLKRTQLLYQTVRQLVAIGKKNPGFGWDLHHGNYMKRPDGTPVIVDPWVFHDNSSTGS